MQTPQETAKVYAGMLYTAVVRRLQSIKAYVATFCSMPSRLDAIEEAIDEIKVCLTNIDRNITELKEIDFVAIGR